MIRYYASDSADAPEPVECEKAGYPNFDARGRMQYDNSHFDTEAEAWERLLAEVRAGVSLSAGQVEQKRRELARAEAGLVEDALRRDRVERAMEKWEREAPHA